VTDSLLRPNEILSGGHVKGGIIRAHLQWVRDYHGPDAVNRLLAALPADVRAEADAAGFDVVRVRHRRPTRSRHRGDVRPGQIAVSTRARALLRQPQSVGRVYSCFSPVYCQSAIGYYEQAIVVHGAKPHPVIEASCQCAGDPSCTFELEWE
jgi:hypothetical protein